MKQNVTMSKYAGIVWFLTISGKTSAQRFIHTQHYIMDFDLYLFLQHLNKSNQSKNLK